MTPPTDAAITHADLKRIEEALRALRDLLDERDRRYSERDAAAKEAVRTAQTSAEKALDILARALAEYKTFSNEWRAALDDLVKRMMTRPEIETAIGTLTDRISELRESRSKTGGRDEVLAEARMTKKWIIGIGVTVALSVLAQIALALRSTP